MIKKNWSFDDIPEQDGKIIIVTGSNSGTGYEAAKELALKGANIILACRNLEKAEIAKEKILSEFSRASLTIMRLDLANLASIREFVGEFSRKYDSLDVLCNNAGVMIPPFQKTADGFELQFGTNHLGHFALTGLLLDKLFKKDNSRVVTMSSSAHNMGKIDFDNLNSEKSYSKYRAYGNSKLANLLFAYELQRKLQAAGKNTISVACHPGWSQTNLQRYSLASRVLNPLFGQSSSKGALPMLYAICEPNVEGGDYFGPRGIMEMRGYPMKVNSSKRSYDLEVAQKLWQVSEKLTGIIYSI